MKVQHLHRYERVTLGKKGYVVFRCNLPECSHYISEKLAKGRYSQCNRCGEQMILDARAMALVKPHCVSCIEVRKKDGDDAILEYLTNDSASSAKS